jgi:hypothetical protein
MLSTMLSMLKEYPNPKVPINFLCIKEKGGGAVAVGSVLLCVQCAVCNGPLASASTFGENCADIHVTEGKVISIATKIINFQTKVIFFTTEIAFWIGRVCKGGFGGYCGKFEESVASGISPLISFRKIRCKALCKFIFNNSLN